MGNSSQEQQYPPLVGQGSLYNNLTFDEVMRNVISVESGQVVQNPSQHDSIFSNNTNLDGASSHKTINEVWREINVHPEHVYRPVNNNLQQSILGDTTLENFLARAMDPMVMSSQPQEWLPLQMPVYKSVYENSIINDIGYSENSMAISIPRAETIPSTCSDSKEFDDVKRKQRYSDEMLEKTIERRQKRMAKNRESAARSRAKKQEHINELEEKAKRLRETNNLLKKMKDVDIWLSSSATTLTPKYQLRRTSSNTF